MANQLSTYIYIYSMLINLMIVKHTDVPVFMQDDLFEWRSAFDSINNLDK